MPDTPIYEDLWQGILTLTHLRFEVTVSMWLNIKYEGQPQDTLVSLVAEPRAAFDEAVDAFVRDHRDDLITWNWRCQLCGSTLNSSGKRGYTRHSDWSGNRCDGCVVNIGPTIDNPAYLREQAGFALAGSGAIESICWNVCSGLAGTPERENDDVQVTLANVLGRLRDRMKEKLAQLQFYLPSLRDCFKTVHSHLSFRAQISAAASSWRA